MALAQIILRRGTAAEWATSNPVLAAGEFGYDTTAKRAKVGDGAAAWTALSWVTMSAADVARLESAAEALNGATAPTDAAMASVQANPASAFVQAQRLTISGIVAPDFQRLERNLEGVPLTVYGDSQAKNPSQGADTGTQFSDRLNGRQRFRNYDNRGVAGTTMGEIASAVVSSWSANSRGLVLVCSGIGNTSTQYGADGQASAARAFRTIMAVLSSRARFPFSSTTFAFDGSWSAGASGVANAVFDFGVNGDTAYLLVNTSTGSGGVLEIRDGSRLITTIDTGSHKAVFPGAYKLSGLGSGDHILRGKLISGSVTVVGLVIPSATPAQIAWVTVEPSRSNVAQRQTYVDACAAVLTDFPTVVRITPASDWNPLQHISDEDGLHLNDRGNAYMADRIETVLASTLDFSQGLNRLTRTTAAAAYTGPIPNPLIVVTTYSGDSFDRPNGVLGNSEVGNKAWTLSTASSVSIVDNAAEWATASATAGTIAYVDDGQGGGKFTAEGINAQSFGLFACGDASLNGYYFFHSNNNGWRIGIRTSSGFTALATAGSTTPPSSAVTIALVRGANGALSGFVDGTPVVSATDTTYSGTRHGIISLVAGRRITAWRHTDQ
ncbi:hypothetical protein [Microbacterium sp. 22296]|uniref:hyaluronate lyase N-terminal domain-containing protein n=1 Tax=Microbacterium sp. 22296 TaxID=3453903 RepID=UPI003F84DF40